MTDSQNITIDSFISDWNTDSNNMKDDFISLKTHLESKSNVKIVFNARPGVSYSLRAAHSAQKKRSLFVMVDVIDDDPDNRWLSVCFYGEMITDPDEQGDLIPGGLLGEDGYCFDHDTASESGINYIKGRIDEAYSSAGKE